MKKAEADMSTKTETARHAASLLGEVEATFQELERLTVEYSRLRGVVPWQAMYETSMRLGHESKRAIKRVRDLIPEAWSFFRSHDFWHPDPGGRLFAVEFETLLELFPQEVDGFESVLPFLQQLHALLLRAVAATAAGSPTAAGDKRKARLPRSVLEQRDPDGSVASTRAGAGETPDGKDYFSVQEVAQQWGLSDDKVRDLFAKEAGVMVLGHNGGRGKQAY